MNYELSSSTDWMRRPRPLVPYCRPASTIAALGSALDLTLAVFKQYADLENEACCFWYGIRDEAGNGEVLAVVVPHQHNTWGNYVIPAESMAAVAKATLEFNWRNLMQIHTHPGYGVEHSYYDDIHANSRRALSVVLPAYGAWGDKWPYGAGVHEFQNGYWHLLNLDDPAHRVFIVETSSSAQLEA